MHVASPPPQGATLEVRETKPKQALLAFCSPTRIDAEDLPPANPRQPPS
jgi:hypothetical protein